MWIAKVQELVEKKDGSQELQTVCFIASEHLRNVYKAAMSECRSQECAIAAIYKDMDAKEADRDDATKKETKAEYLISKGMLGAIDVYGKRHDRKLHRIRENRTEVTKGETKMTLEKIYEMGLIKDNTEIYIRDKNMGVIARGNWYQDNVLDHMKDEIECFTWQDDNKLYIDVK